MAVNILHRDIIAFAELFFRQLQKRLSDETAGSVDNGRLSKILAIESSGHLIRLRAVDSAYRNSDITSEFLFDLAKGIADAFGVRHIGADTNCLASIPVDLFDEAFKVLWVSG
jgi:hypothetical protein